MKHQPRALRLRFWMHLTTLTATILIAAFTLLFPHWIENLTGTDPDQGSGAAEWFTALTIIAVSVFSTTATRREWRRATPPQQPGPS